MQKKTGRKPNLQDGTKTGLAFHGVPGGHFPDLKDKYQVMSVPCLVINGEKTVFGKKNVEQLVELLAD